MNGSETALDLLTQQFIVHRWHTTLGREVRDKVVWCIKNNQDIAQVLQEYILEHPTNVESYEYPYYPPDAMQDKEFWVLAIDDLRGIHFYDEDFSSTTALAKMNISYSSFSRCTLFAASLELTSINYSTFEHCDMQRCTFTKVNCTYSKFTDCLITQAAFLDSHIQNCDFSNSNLDSVYFENTKLRHLGVNYLTQFDLKLRTQWRDRNIPDKQLPDLYRSIRFAYENAELYSLADHYYFHESVLNRKCIVWPQAKHHRKWKNSYVWLRDYSWGIISGYGTKPARTVFLGALISLIYSVIYYVAGTPPDGFETETNLSSALYFSFTTFATLGYGDLSYPHTRPWMRLLSTSEAWLGAVLIAMFVVILSRKIIRR